MPVELPRIAYKLAVITYRTRRSTGTPVYLTDLIKNYHPSRTLRSADKLLLSAPRMTLALNTLPSPAQHAPLISLATYGAI